MRTRRAYQLGRLARSDPPSDNSCRPGRSQDRSPDVNYRICSSFLHFALLIRIDRDFQNVLLMVIFLDLADDGSLLDLHVVLRGLVAVRVHDLIGTMRYLMLNLQLELVTRLLRQTYVMLQACEMFLRPFLLLYRLLWPCRA